MNHDQQFKRLLKGFFYDFLQLFLPAIAQGIEPDSIDFLDTTDFTNQPGGGYRVADLAARAKLRDELTALIILHTEIESEPDADFPYRMWEYNALFRLKHQLPVISIALLPFMVGQGIELARYTETLLGQEYIKLEYWRVPLRGLNADEYLAAAPPLAIALAALMRPASADRVDLKTAIFVRMYNEKLAPGTRGIYFEFVETYLRLTGEEQAAFNRRMTPEGDVTMETLERTWLEEQIQLGIEQHAPWADRLIQEGLERGALQAKRESLMLVVRARFGAVPADLPEKLAKFDEQQLDRLLEQVAQSATLEIVMAAIDAV